MQRKDIAVKLIGKILCIVPVFLAILGTILVKLLNTSFIVIPTESEFHFGLMTVNALFGGFLYSNYGLLVGLLDNDTIQKVKGTNIMVRRNAQVLAGIAYATLSVACGLYICLAGMRDGIAYEWLFCLMINGEVAFMIAAIVFYLLSLVEMNCLVKALYHTRDTMGERRIKELKKEILNAGQEGRSR